VGQELLAIRSPEYEELADAVGYAVDLADMALMAGAGVSEEQEW